MNLKTGDRVKVIDGYGNVIVEQAVVTMEISRGTVFVREVMNGKAIFYGVPVCSTEKVKINTRPCLEEVVATLRTCFGLSDKNESR